MGTQKTWNQNMFPDLERIGKPCHRAFQMKGHTSKTNFRPTRKLNERNFFDNTQHISFAWKTSLLSELKNQVSRKNSTFITFTTNLYDIQAC